MGILTDAVTTDVGVEVGGVAVFDHLGEGASLSLSDCHSSCGI